MTAMTMTGEATLLDQFNNLPTLPKAIRDLLIEFDRDNVNLDRVIALVRADPVLSVKLLRLSNSAFYHRSGSVSRVEDAVILLGLSVVRNLVLAVGLASGIRFPASFPRQCFWRFSLHSAVVARHLAGALRGDRETAFTLGLIRAIGVPLMYGALTAEMSALDAGGSCFFDADRCALEKARVGFGHVELAADLAARWHFPKASVEALRCSQQPLETQPVFITAALLRIAAWVAGAHEEGADLRDGVPGELSQLLLRVGLDESDLAAMPPLRDLAAGLESLLD